MVFPDAYYIWKYILWPVSGSLFKIVKQVTTSTTEYTGTTGIIMKVTRCQKSLKSLNTDLWKRTWSTCGIQIWMFHGAFNLIIRILSVDDVPNHRKSARNCTWIYGVAYAENEKNLRQNWLYMASLKEDHIYNSFLIILLLEDHFTQNSILAIPDHGDQAKWFTEAIRA